MRITRILPAAVNARVISAAFILFMVFAVSFIGAQTNASGFDPKNPPPHTADADPEAEQIRQRMEREAVKKWNKERQAALQKDTDKLLQMATELKQQVDKSNENILSLDVIKKAEAIEKLSRSVRDKMRANSY